MKLVKKYLKGGPKLEPNEFVGDTFKGFALLAGFPETKNRTPEWDEDENIFNEKDDTAYLKAHNLAFTRTDNGYYLDDKGKYFPGTIYAQNPWGGMNHYTISPTEIEYRETHPSGGSGTGYYDMKNLSLNDYNNLQGLGLEVNRFYKDDDEAAMYIPSADIKFNNTYTVGNSRVTYDDPFIEFLAPNRANQKRFNKMLHGDGSGDYHIVDPDNGYDFTIHSGRLRDGGSLIIRINGKYPAGLEEGMVYASPISNSQKAIDEANARRDAVNKILSPYILTFGNSEYYAQGGRLKKRSNTLFH